MNNSKIVYSSGSVVMLDGSTKPRTFGAGKGIAAVHNASLKKAAS